MAKKKQKNSEEKQNPGNIKAGHYTPSMVSFLGYDAIKIAYDESIMAIEDQQRFSSEVRTKGLHTAALLATLSVGLIAVISAVDSTAVRIVTTLLAAILLGGLYAVFKKIIFRKSNVTRGSTQAYSLDEGMIDVLRTVEPGQRAAFFLASGLKGMERDAVRQKCETDRMQQSYENITKTMIILIGIVLVVSAVLAFLIKTPVPAY